MQEQMQSDQTRSDIEVLQTKVAFQEHTIEMLSQALADQQKQLEKLSFQMKHVVDRLKHMQGSNIANESEEAPPPHY
ncbi:SlyX family protein [Aliiglaciecola sp. CAU 1673]|uniref:SlyX family protein n=1 Tax=Aliiglaciecola sp. CAU 1673 TaxID=3032595 RepID=UPI0023DCBD3A|nr:SlyX family protein [Aliiglaciecola sp. CAU 1673]MDF2179237.1 SlyX family protein [Aliiglaciecola sp. CAU 1673]